MRRFYMPERTREYTELGNLVWAACKRLSSGFALCKAALPWYCATTMRAAQDMFASSLVPGRARSDCTCTHVAYTDHCVR